MPRLSCLVLTNDRTCRDTLRLAATFHGWPQREERLAPHAATGDRPSVVDDYDLVFVDLRHLVGAARRRAWEIVGCTGGRPAKLVVVCGAPENPLEERWTWELGANLYLPGTPVSAAVDCVCRHLGGTAYTSAASNRSVSRPVMAPDADSRRLVAGLLRLDAVFEAGRLTAADCEALGAEIARVHGRLAVADPAAGFGTATSVLDAAAINLEQLRGLRPDAGARIDRIAAWLHDRLAAAADTIAVRIAGGRVRECHGDLHLANIVLHDARMMAFDAIEFSPGLRWIDVANDVAFLAMDLHVRGRPDLAALVETAWVEAADDHAALAVLPIYEVYRAVVRADVAALGGAGPDVAPDTAAAIRGETDRYLDVAERLMQPREPVLFVTSGISGSGKTTLATRLVAAAGAVRIRSDVERKRLAGMAATDRPADATATAALYDPALTRRVYDRLALLARTALAAGRSVVVDAACNARWQRQILAAAARDVGVELVWLEFAVPAEILLARVTRRAVAGSDASDASAAVVREQIAAREPITAEELAAAGPRCRLVPVTPEALADAAFVTTLTRPASRAETGRCRS